MLSRSRWDPIRVEPHSVLVAIDVLGDAPITSYSHQDIQVCKEALDNVTAARLTLVCHSPYIQASDHDSMCAQCDSFEDIRASPHTRVEENGQLCGEDYLQLRGIE